MPFSIGNEMEEEKRKPEKTRYWLKLEKGFLDSKYIKVIKNMPNGKEYILFYLALMLESIESVGHLKFTELVPYDEHMLSALTDTNVDIVRSAMKIFKELGIVTILNDGTIFLPDVPRLTGKESDSAERVRLFRARKNQQALQCNTDVTIYNDNKEKQSIKHNEQSKETEKIPYLEIIDYLNSKSGSHYRNTDSTRRLIHARINEGFTKEDFFKVIDNKVSSWTGSEFEKFIRPQTLFSPKFESYLNEKPKDSKTSKNDIHLAKSIFDGE
jgi:uncharacterized phage protein (TIGR02220 family)/predicted phage replisome organizer